MTKLENGKTKGRRESIFCPIHGISIKRLRYQKTKSGIRIPIWIYTDWFWCEKCNRPIQLKTEIIT